MTIGDRIKQVRNARGLTQKQLGAISGTSEITIRQYELGKRQPRLEQLQRIAAALGVSPFYLLGDETGKMSRDDIMASMALEDYLKSLGYEFVVDYEYEGEGYNLCIDRKRKKLYLIPPQRLAELERSLESFARFSLSELERDGEEISDTEGWFSCLPDALQSIPAPQNSTGDLQDGIDPTPTQSGQETAPEGE